MKQSFIKHLELAGERRGTAQIFTDFLTICVCTLSCFEKEDLYLKTIQPYSKEELNNLCSAFAELVSEMDNKGEGLKDCLGDYYMEVLANDANGQFFTSESVCDLIAQITESTKHKSIYDPCCGSGRFFLSSAKINRNSYFVGADVDINCCRMTLINMCLNGLKGRISHMNSITKQEWHRWEIKKHSKYLFPYIHEVDLSINDSHKTDIMDIKVEEQSRDGIIKITSSMRQNEYSELLESVNYLL